MAMWREGFVPGERFLTVATAYMFEHRMSKFLEANMEDFLEGTENAVLDCGLVAGAPLVCPPSIDQTHIARLDRARAENRQVVPLDFKTVSPRLLPHSPHLTRFDIKCTASQREHCAAYIVMNPAAPDWVALIPAAFTGGSVNPWNGLAFELPQLPLKPVDLLTASHDTDGPFIRELQISFQDYAHEYRIEIPRVVKTGGGDFVIHHLPSNERAWVELKLSGATFVTKADVLRLKSRGSGLTAGLPFDFALFTDPKGSFAILAARGEIPPDWLHGHTGQRKPTHSRVSPWQDATSMALRLAIPLSSPLGKPFVESMVHMLDTHRGQGSFSAPGPISISGQALEVEESEDSEDSEALESEEVHSAGINGHERKQGYLLRHSCEESRNGSILPLFPRASLRSHQLSGSHFYSPCKATLSRLHELPLNTPGLFINFFHVKDLFNQFVPRQRTPKQALKSAINGRHKSFTILTAVPDTMLDLCSRVYLVPSEAIVDNEEYLFLNPLGTPIDAYKTDMRQVPQQLRKVFTLPPSKKTLFFGDEETGSGVMINAEDYITTKAALLEEVRDILLCPQDEEVEMHAATKPATGSLGDPQTRI